MSMSFRITPFMALVMLALGSYQTASAQAQHGRSNLVPPAPADDPAAVPPLAVAAGHTLVKTYLRQGVYEANIGATSQVLDTVAVNCPKGPCSINAHLLAENGNSLQAGNQTVLWFAVDGAPVALCFEYFAGQTPSDGSWDNVTQDCYLSGVGTGNHTLQYYYYSTYGATLDHWQATYTLYTP